MQDPMKIKGVLEALNSANGLGKGKWVEAAGYHALLTMEVKNNLLTAVPGSAIGIKVFVNTETGELKTYLAKFFDPEAAAVPPAAVSTAVPPGQGQKDG
jgi:hypothetical protein